MAEARGRAAWDHTSLVVAMLINTNPFRDPKRKPVGPRTFHPYHQTKFDPRIEVNLADLKDGVFNFDRVKPKR